LAQISVEDDNEMLTSSINMHDSRADLIRNASIITCDEAPMTNKAVLACMEEVCRNVTHTTAPFGGKVVILLGDFRQTCPVVRKGSKQDTIDACIKSSPLWPLFTIETLNTPIRNTSDPEYAAFLTHIGDGTTTTVNLDMLRNVSTEEELISSVFPNDILHIPETCLTRAILAPTNKQVDHYNHLIYNMLANDSRTYLATDSLKEAADADIMPPTPILDYITTHSPPGLPPPTLQVKVGAMYRILRNFSIERGLVKNARVLVTRLGTRLIGIRLLNNDGPSGEEILLPRITFTAALPSHHTLLRKQFPIALAYAASLHSCQGLTLTRVGLELNIPCFTHGQLYTALSRVRKRSDITIKLPINTTTTPNVTYSEILI